MDDSEFIEYLAKYGADRDDIDTFDEERLELEAQMYSQIHYEATPSHNSPQIIPKDPQDDPEITDNLSLNLLNEFMIHSKPEKSENQPESGISSTRRQIEKNCQMIMDKKSPVTSKYESVNGRRVPLISKKDISEDDSEEDSGIQVVSGVKRMSKKSALKVPSLIDLVASDTTASDSEVECLPTDFRPRKTKEKLVIEAEEDRQDAM